MKNLLKKLECVLCVYVIIAVLFVAFDSEAFAQEKKTGRTETSSGNLISRVAPGDFLPISVKLINFGGGRRVDVSINYQIIDENGNEVISQVETVAVETTANFVKVIQIPYQVPSGKYRAVSSIIYEGQKVPAVSQFEFTVERKFAGIFVSQLLVYGIVTLLIALAFAVVSRLIIKKRRARRITTHEYLDIPKKERIFYEIISDTIMQMRYRVGEQALELAGNIDGLVVDENSGKVLEIKKSPEKIVALLILQYEKHLGEKVSFAMRGPGKKPKARLAEVEKNLVVVRKYFE